MADDFAPESPERDPLDEFTDEFGVELEGGPPKPSGQGTGFVGGRDALEISTLWVSSNRYQKSNDDN